MFHFLKCWGFAPPPPHVLENIVQASMFTADLTHLHTSEIFKVTIGKNSKIDALNIYFSRRNPVPSTDDERVSLLAVQQ